MYNLIMMAREEAFDGSSATIGTDRFLEHTVEHLKGQFQNLADQRVVAKLREMPTLFAYEKQVERSARVGWLASVFRRGTSIEFSFRFDQDFDPIDADAIERLRRKLGLEGLEENRQHWAVKDVDLLALLGATGFKSEHPIGAPAAYSFSRSTVASAATMLANLGHSELSQFLLETGLGKLVDAGTNRGGRLARATIIGEYVVANMDQPTLDGEPMALAVVREAAALDLNYPDGVLADVKKTTREKFWGGLRHDGYRFVDGHIVEENRHGPLIGSVQLPTVTEALRSMGHQSPPSGAKGPLPMPVEQPAPVKSDPPKVFLVHGRENAAKNDVARFLERIGLDVVILHEQANGGRTLISKFQEVAEGVQFAVVLMTPEDEGALIRQLAKPRARQNVIFELGFFIGKIGPARVAALVAGELERPSDFEGVVYIEYGERTTWKAELARELREAKVPFNADKVF